MPEAFDAIHEFPRSRRWHAKWIWFPGEPNAPNSFYLFRRKLDLSPIPDEVSLHIAADTRYQLYINGKFIGRGAPQSQPFFQYYDTWSVVDQLNEGPNIIGVIANYVGNLDDTRGGLLLEVVDGADRTLLATDDGWRVRRADAWASDTFFFRMNKATPYQEVFDARRMPAGWHRIDFDDSAWRGAKVVQGRISDRPPAVSPWTRLVPRDIPHMTAEPVLPVVVTYTEECLDIANRMRGEDLSIGLSTPGRPVSCSTLEAPENLCSGEGVTVVQCSTQHLDHVFDGVYDPCIVLDFGRVVSGYPRVELEGVAGAQLEIGYAERLIDGHFNNALEGQFADRYIMVDGAQTYQPFTWKAFRYLKIRLRDAIEPVTIRSLKAIVSTYPYEERGSFDSDDATLNAVWGISRYTLRLCSNEFIMDTPWREQAQWLGDVAAVTLGGIYACFGDTALPGKFLRQAARNQHPTGMISNVSNSVNHHWQGAIPDYSLWWIMGLWNHYLFTGDARWVHSFYPEALRVFQAHLPYVNERGLVEDMPYWPFIDWANVDRRGECTAYNAIFYGALGALTRLAEVKGDVYTREKADLMRATMRREFQPRLFDPARGVFADARIDGGFSDLVSEHGNMAAIYWDLCDEATTAGIIAALYEDKTVDATEAQPFFTTVVLQALDRVGRFDLALEIVRDRWGGRMVDRGASSVFEEWGINGSWRSGEYDGFLRTQSHAWSAHPAEFLIKNLMGLEILVPGCSRVRLTPKITDFDYEAVYPTPLGAVRVENAGGELTIEAPNAIEILD
ncbi:MAG: family 78 glycoside hydrolase catalytic domain [Anaerolineae bacterium]